MLESYLQVSPNGYLVRHYEKEYWTKWAFRLILQGFFTSPIPPHTFSSDQQTPAKALQFVAALCFRTAQPTAESAAKP